MAVSGEIPSLRSGHSARIPFTALERWIENNTSGGLEP
jgi:excisionase family DNA binding protein